MVSAAHGGLEINRRQIHWPGCPNLFERHYCTCRWRVDNPNDGQNQVTDHFPYCNNVSNDGVCFCPARTRPLTPPLVIPNQPGYSSPLVPLTPGTPSSPPAMRHTEHIHSKAGQDEPEAISDIRQATLSGQAIDEIERIIRENRFSQ
ncbi:hypothetical protein CORC01_10349 [Colletotrichum orchidophilum]|uniref:Uncharacterized protein n=1 Tax=Colletotrichum orchidophilum TaxID=1209926 RepID=A0A1G4AZ36_9PEZI|nr:uncharacterized protein CORC01_10349 [Colletotrichum orchidophilum]OHE94302.1 hypothetical protein CORC01_10349 [Colletotrichum orchidophilum]